MRRAAMVAAVLAPWPAGAAPAPPPAAFPLACVYVAKASSLETAAACAARTARGVALAPAVAALLRYDRGLASFALPGGSWYYRRRDGAVQEMATFEAGPDGFVEGLARARIAGRLAYVDRRLRVRLRTRYDWGDRFEKGRATVCTGCVATALDGGEHTIMTGGRWGVIDRAGREIVPVIHAADALPAR